jgi:hypothetical protein
MGLFQFTAKPRSIVPRELLNLQSRIGGSIGQVISGMDKADVLKVRDNVYVTAKKPSASLKAMINLGRADIHTIDHPADILLLKARLEALDG